MQATINGTPLAIEPGQTLASLLEAAGYQAKGGMAVAIDSAVVRRADWDKTIVPDGAEILIINAAYGG